MTRRTHRLALVALAILIRGHALTACGGSPRGTIPSPTRRSRHQPPPRSQPPRSPLGPARERPASSPTTATPGSDFGFIRSWTAKAGTFYLRFDWPCC